MFAKALLLQDVNSAKYLSAQAVPEQKDDVISLPDCA